MKRQPLFPLGVVVTTPGAKEVLHEMRLSPKGYLEMHMTGNWGDVDHIDKAINDRALDSNDRVVSRYALAPRVSLWITTYPGRTMTKVSITSLMVPNYF